VEWTVDGDVVDVFLGLVLQVFGKIDHLPAWFQVLVGHVLDPSGDRGREKKELGIFLDFALDFMKNFVNILFEPKLEHLVSFVQNQRFQFTKLYVSSLDVVKNTSSGSHEDVNSLSKLIGLFVDRHSSIHCQHIVLSVVVLEIVEHSRDL